MLLEPRYSYSPFEYEQAYKFVELQQQAHWLPSEVTLTSDINDWKTILTPSEKNIIGNTLKGFTQSEVFIQDYWSSLVTKWFKKPEIRMMAVVNAQMEVVHSISYSNLSQSLGLDDFEAFLLEPSAKAKIDRLIAPSGSSKEQIARSLAIFSAFNEGVNLFSSFAILLNFSRFNKLKGVGQIIAFSARDEQLHSTGGCWLFRTLMQEYPEIWTDELKKDIYDAARLTIQLEDEFIDKVFELGDAEGLTKREMKNFIRHRCNTKLNEIGLKSNWKNIDKELIKNMDWFHAMVYGVSNDDFFAATVSDYTKGVVDFSKIWDD